MKTDQLAFITVMVIVGLINPERGLTQTTILRSVSFYTSILECGARPNDNEKDTESIQKAIDSCHEQGGGTVYFPSGRFLSGSLHLRSNVALFLDAGAILTACQEDSDSNVFDSYETLDYPNDADHETSFFHYALIWGEDLNNVMIAGAGTIDGNRCKRGGPKPIALKRCENVTIKDISIINSPNYCISMLGTDYVNIDGVTILNGYCDGIDPDCCHHVRISNCHIETWDDAIVLKSSFSLGYHRSTENITITNCLLATGCNCFKLGTESGGDFKHIALSNCVMFKLPYKRPPISGIALESVDGANLDGVVISNVTMVDVMTPIFMRLGNRGRDLEIPRAGSLKNVSVSNVIATGAGLASSITGIPNHMIENVNLDNIRISYCGGGVLEQSKIDVPENVDKYPGAKMFGELPAYGFFCRHVAELTMQKLRVSVEENDMRHALVCGRGSNLIIDDFSATTAKGAAAMIKFENIQGAIIRNCNTSSLTGTFLKVSGQCSSNIKMLGNDLSGVNQVVSFEDGASKSSLIMASNLLP